MSLSEYQAGSREQGAMRMEDGAGGREHFLSSKTGWLNVGFRQELSLIGSANLAEMFEVL